MQHLVRLFNDLDASTSTPSTIEALGRYCQQADLHDMAWLLDRLTGSTSSPRVLPLASLRAPAQARSGLDDPLFEASLSAVGNLAETIGLVLPLTHTEEDADHASWPVHRWWHDRLLPLRKMPMDARAAPLIDWLLPLDPDMRLLVIKLATGTLRWRVDPAALTQALAHHAGCSVPDMAQRLDASSRAQRGWDVAQVQALWGATPRVTASRDAGQPMPFVPHQITSEDSLHTRPIDDWLCQWAIQGTRVQIVREQGRTWVWSSSLELMTDRWPALVDQSQAWPEGTVVEGTVPDGDVLGLGWQAHDLLVWQGEPLTPMPLARRHALLTQEAAPCCGLPTLPEIIANDIKALDGWRQRARQHHARGLLIRARHDGVHEHAFAQSWPTDPFVVQAVLTYVQPQAGLSASGTWAGTFALKRDDAPDQTEAPTWVTVTKADLTLTDAQRQALNLWIRQHTLKKFGPVREVPPTQVFDIGFDALERSRRHQCGWRLSGVRVLGWRPDLLPEQADGLSRLNDVQNIDKPMTQR